MKTKSIPNLKFKDLGNDAFSVSTPTEHISLNSVILLVAKKQSGKTFFASNLMNQLKQVKACDRIFVISDTFNSNKKMMEHLDIDREDIFSPNDPNVIPEITKRIEAERDDLLEYRQNLKLYNQYRQTLEQANRYDTDITEEMLLFYNPDTGRFEKPKHKYNGRKPAIFIFCDDIQSSQLVGDRKFRNFVIKHRHIGAFENGEPPIGCSMIIAVQNYTTQGNEGLPKAIRGNANCVAVWKTGNVKELDLLATELSGGTVLQTHTLADGETSFTFTQTETSYATFNYVLKLSGTQTDTYSAGYTPPPTPTFDIALTNEDLAITATLTDIVNPDPYYTVSFYDSSSQVASHTFSTNETGVVLNWNETTYGTKAYTIEINVASHSSHNIQLNEAVVFSDIEVLVSPQGNGDTATNITTNLLSGYTPNPPHDSAIKQRLSNNNTNTHDLANAVAWRNSDNNTDTKIIYEFPFITNVSKWEIWDARLDWTFTNYHVWFGDTEASLTKYATNSFNPTTVWNNATPNSQTRTLSPVKETKYMAFSFDDISTNPSTGQGTAGPGVAEIKIWGYPSSTVSY
ncbi:unnamed protein product [Bathycoccus prasinos]